MRYSLSAATAVLAMAASALAQKGDPDFISILTPTTSEPPHAGQPYVVKWKCLEKYLNEQIELHLICGQTQNTQVRVENSGDIAPQVLCSNNQFTWKVPSDAKAYPYCGVVGSLMKDSNTMQFSMPFQIVGAKAAAQEPPKHTQSQTGAVYPPPVLTTASASAPQSIVSAPSAAFPTKCVNKTTGATVVPVVAAPSAPAYSLPNSNVSVATTGAGSLVGASFLSVLGGVAVALAL